MSEHARLVRIHQLLDPSGKSEKSIEELIVRIQFKLAMLTILAVWLIASVVGFLVAVAVGYVS